jgi:hypothetical protein
MPFTLSMFVSSTPLISAFPTSISVPLNTPSPRHVSTILLLPSLLNYGSWQIKIPPSFGLIPIFNFWTISSQTLFPSHNFVIPKKPPCSL